MQEEEEEEEEGRVRSELPSSRERNYKLRYTGPWMLLYGGSNLDTTLDLRALETNLGVKVGWRTAAVSEDDPDPWETLLAERTTNGSHPEAASLSGKTSQLLVQGSVWGTLTTGTTPKTAWSRLWTSVRGAGWVVARQRILLTPSSGRLRVPVGQPFPCAGVTGLMFGIMYTGVSGTIDDPTPLWRSFETGDARMPGSWTALTAMADVTGDTKVNSGNNAVTTTGKLMAQAGFEWATTGTNPNGVAEILVAAKM